nr:MAG TPA: hypothetical protein [Caudoviricetes sp.]
MCMNVINAVGIFIWRKFVVTQSLFIALCVAQGWCEMTRLGYVLEERNGTIHFFESKNELVEFVANELEQQSIEMYAIETIERADGSHIRWYFYRQSGSEVVRDEA